MIRKIVVGIVLVLTISAITIAYSLPANAQINNPCFANTTCDNGSSCACEGCGSCVATCPSGGALCICGSCGGIQ